MDKIREFEVLVKGVPDSHSARHLQGILTQALLNLGMEAQVEMTEMTWQD